MFQLRRACGGGITVPSKPSIVVIYAANLPRPRQIEAKTDDLLDANGMPLDDIEITDQAKFLMASLPGGQIAIDEAEPLTMLKFRWAPVISNAEFGTVWRLYASVRGNHDPLRWRTLLTCLSPQADAQDQNILCPWAAWPLSLECLGIDGTSLNLGASGLTQWPSSWAAAKVTELRMEKLECRVAHSNSGLAHAA